MSKTIALKSFIIIILSISSLLCTAQHDSVIYNDNSNSENIFSNSLKSDTLEIKVKKEGSIDIMMDPRIIQLVQYRHNWNDSVGTIPGYRVQIFQASGPNSRSFALEEKAKFIRFYEEVPIYMKAEMPYFKIRVGDFESRLTALGFMSEIKTLYPNAIVVPDDINIVLE